MDDELVPIGAVVTDIHWWSTPDKYAGPARFPTLAEAEAYNDTGLISVELTLRTEAGDSVVLTGGVPSVEPALTTSPRQGDGVLPERGAVLIGSTPKEKRAKAFLEGTPLAGDQSFLGRVAYHYSELVFANADGARFVLYPMLHPMHGRS